MITIRPAVAADVDWILEELRAFDRFFDARALLMPADSATARTIVEAMIAGPFFIAENGTARPVGFIAGVLGPHLYNPDLIVLTETFWWVTPIARGGRAGFALLNYFCAYGQQHADATVMTLEANSPVNPETITRLGFAPKETSYLAVHPRAQVAA